MSALRAELAQERTETARLRAALRAVEAASTARRAGAGPTRVRAAAASSHEGEAAAAVPAARPGDASDIPVVVEIGETFDFSGYGAAPLPQSVIKLGLRSQEAAMPASAEPPGGSIPADVSARLENLFQGYPISVHAHQSDALDATLSRLKAAHMAKRRGKGVTDGDVKLAFWGWYGAATGDELLPHAAGFQRARLEGGRGAIRGAERILPARPAADTLEWEAEELLFRTTGRHTPTDELRPLTREGAEAYDRFVADVDAHVTYAILCEPVGGHPLIRAFPLRLMRDLTAHAHKCGVPIVFDGAQTALRSGGGRAAPHLSQWAGLRSTYEVFGKALGGVAIVLERFESGVTPAARAAFGRQYSLDCPAGLLAPLRAYLAAYTPDVLDAIGRVGEVLRRHLRSLLTVQPAGCAHERVDGVGLFVSTSMLLRVSCRAGEVGVLTKQPTSRRPWVAPQTLRCTS